MKAIHNAQIEGIYKIEVVTNMSKIQNESYSQLVPRAFLSSPCCDQHVKDAK